MVLNTTDVTLWPCLHSLRFLHWTFPCALCRGGGIIILMISVLMFTFNTRFLFFQRCQNGLVISLFVASLSVIVISVPGVLVQLFTCHRHCLKVYCLIEGFFSYFSGCLCMLVFMVLSIHRYLSLCSYKRSTSYQWSTFICWFLSLLFTFPLMFGYFNSYQPEGLGFHCSVNWQDRSITGRLYIFFSFVLMYFLPLAILIIVNCQSHAVVRDMYAKHYLNREFSVSDRHLVKPNRPISNHDKISVNKFCVRKATERRRFRIDYRFLRAIIFLVSTYIIAWTPYSIVAVLQLLNIQFVFENPFIVTLSAFLAKSSVILSPFVYLSIMNYRFFKKILFQ